MYHDLITAASDKVNSKCIANKLRNAYSTRDDEISAQKLKIRTLLCGGLLELQFCIVLVRLVLCESESIPIVRATNLCQILCNDAINS